MEIERLYREEWGRILATVIRLVGSFDLAEEAVQEAFAAALQQWPRDGVPHNPRAWLVSTARNKAVDQLRRSGTLQDTLNELGYMATGKHQAEPELPDGPPDERLSLIFTCCHPSIALEAQVALTLRTLCGLSTDEIARAFLVPQPTMAQRLVRTKQKILDARIPYRVPARAEFAERLEAVMLVVYLVFNEGYNATSGDTLTRGDLCGEAIRLGRVLRELLPQNPEAIGLLALMLLHDSRRAARTASDGSLVTLEEQDRSQWDHAQIEEGTKLLEPALRAGRPGPYVLQAAVAALHAQAERASETDWPQIVALYEILLRVRPSAIIELNHAAAVGMAKGPLEGLRLLDALQSRGDLEDYHLLPAARADLLRRAGLYSQAADAYRSALELVKSRPETDYLRRRLASVEQATTSISPSD